MWHNAHIASTAGTARIYFIIRLCIMSLLSLFSYNKNIIVPLLDLFSRHFASLKLESRKSPNYLGINTRAECSFDIPVAATGPRVHCVLLQYAIEYLYYCTGTYNIVLEIPVLE